MMPWRGGDSLPNHCCPQLMASAQPGLAV